MVLLNVLIKEKIGSGAYGVVYRARQKSSMPSILKNKPSDNCNIVVKIMTLSPSKTEQDLIVDEINTLIELKRSNFITKILHKIIIDGTD